MHYTGIYIISLCILRQCTGSNCWLDVAITHLLTTSSLQGKRVHRVTVSNISLNSHNIIIPLNAWSTTVLLSIAECEIEAFEGEC